ncbi:NAD(P)-dependent alcohol dehydrogenase [Rhodococcus sp. T2V]|uniref:NAD(P)-dependent alcohol dehydrogenase n=1 Tax=Rhodococcus sp. T2V TaxID=3034164 RepID=UPI0023E0E4C0|nr:NAD(P)-dependent alcohol dehydrogenase [Rhodococcus sp. T2V]MDF3311085.1 NAD(P)-dependent alcohol dehydrogenase [Rhodococcus sp. T2V]
MKVKAAVLEEYGNPLAIRDLELGEPQANEVQIKVVSCGVCHTDAVVRDGWLPTRPPVVLGHEGAGIVEKVGAGVAHLEPGDHVVASVSSCGTCQLCLSGHPTSCLESFGLNFMGGRPDQTSAFSDSVGAAVGSHFFGQSSFAEHAIVAARSLVKIPEDFPLELAGPLGCGIQTGAGSVLNVLKPDANGNFVVFGAGAVGLSALLAAVSSRVKTIVAVDVNDDRLALAKELGATHTINGSTEDSVARIREITQSGAQTALDTTGNAGVFQQMIESLAVAGHAGSVGASAAGTNGSVDLQGALARGIKISWIVEGDAVPQTFIPHLIALYRAGDFPFDRLIQTYPFEEINVAFADSESGKVIKPVVLL